MFEELSLACADALEVGQGEVKVALVGWMEESWAGRTSGCDEIKRGICEGV